MRRLSAFWGHCGRSHRTPMCIVCARFSNGFLTNQWNSVRLLTSILGGTVCVSELKPSFSCSTAYRQTKANQNVPRLIATTRSILIRPESMTFRARGWFGLAQFLGLAFCTVVLGPQIAARAEPEAVTVDEPVTSRPVANRFDFTNNALGDLVSSQRFAQTPSKTETAASDVGGNKGGAGGEPRKVIAARPVPGAKVAGWRQLKTLSPEQAQNTDVETVAAPPALSALELDANGNTITAKDAEAQAVEAENKLRRRRSASRNTKATPSSQSSGSFGKPPSWETRALFPD